MDVKTGVTIYDNVLCVDSDGFPATAGTLSYSMYINGVTGSTPTLSLTSVNPVTGMVVATFTPIVYGMHQFALVHSITGMRYISDIYNAKPASETDVTVYVGI